MQTARPLVTVVIPAHDPGEYLRDAIASVQAQTYENWECVVVDDGSTEDLSWVESVSPVVRRLRQRKAGVSAARNAGIRAAGGEFIAFLDSDDVWEPTKLQVQLSVWDDSAAFSATGFYRFAGAARWEGRPPQATEREGLLRDNSILMSSVLVRRDRLLRVGGFDEGLRAAEDWDLWLRLLTEGPLLAIDEPLSGYRLHDGQTSGDPFLIWRFSMRVILTQRGPLTPSLAGIRRMGEVYGAQMFDRFRASRKPVDLLLASIMDPRYVAEEARRLPGRVLRKFAPTRRPPPHSFVGDAVAIAGPPLITVVIPAFDPGPYLRDALASVQAQTYPRWECVVVDDGSSEDLSWVDGFSDRVRRIRQSNAGLPAARNTGIRHARGELIAFLDADDLWLPTKLATQWAAWTHGAAMSATGFYRFTETERFEGWPPTPADRDGLLHGNSICVSTVLVHRGAIEGLGGFDETLRSAEDWDMWLRLLTVGTLTTLDEVLAGYRVHGGQMSGRPLRMWRYSLRVIRKQRAPLGPSLAGARRMGELYGAQMFDIFRTGRRPTALLLAAVMDPLYVARQVACRPLTLWRRWTSQRRVDVRTPERHHLRRDRSASDAADR